MKKLQNLLFISILLCSQQVVAQFDFTQSIECINSSPEYTYYQYQQNGVNLNEYVAAKKQVRGPGAGLGSFGITTYAKYGFIRAKNFSISIGVPFSLGIEHFSMQAMIDLNIGMHTQKFNTEISQRKRYGFYVGAGIGFVTFGTSSVIVPTALADIPKNQQIIIVDKDIYPNKKAEYPYEPLYKSVGINIHSAFSYNFYKYKEKGRFMAFLPSGIRFQAHISIDDGPSYYSVGIVYNYRMLTLEYAKENYRENHRYNR